MKSTDCEICFNNRMPFFPLNTAFFGDLRNYLMDNGRARGFYLQPRRREFGRERLHKMADRETGTVKWFDNSKGYGFIQRAAGEDVFVHFRAIQGEAYRTLNEGQQVEFSVVQGQKRLQAEDVAAVE